MVLDIIVVVPEDGVEDPGETGLDFRVELVAVDEEVDQVGDRLGGELGAVAVEVHQVADIREEVELDLVQHKSGVVHLGGLQYEILGQFLKRHVVNLLD